MKQTEFSRKQINDLITGVQLSAEIPSSSPELRHFVSVRGYTQTEHGTELPDRIIDEDKIETLVFWLRDYEIPGEYIENDWDIPDNEIRNDTFIKGIIGIENLRKELERRIPYLSLLEPHWKCDAPLG